MAPTIDFMETAIKNSTSIIKLKKLRDTGLDAILSDPTVRDFTEKDKANFIVKINARIIELGGTI